MTTDNSAVGILRQLLLGSELADSVTYDKFKSFFPSKYRSDEDHDQQIRKIYVLYQRKRTGARELVAQNIETNYIGYDRALAGNSTTVHDQSLAHAVDYLSNHVLTLQEELESTMEELSVLKKHLYQFDKSIDSVKVVDDLKPEDLHIDNLQDLIQLLSEDASSS